MAESRGMPSCGVRIYSWDYVTGGALPSSVLSLSNPVEVPQVREATCEGDDDGACKITHLNSLDFAEEVVRGWTKAKTLTAVCIYSENDMATLQAMRIAGTLAAMNPPGPPINSRGRKVIGVVYPDGAAMLSIGFLNMIGEQIPAAGNDDPITIPITFQLSGRRKFVDVA